MTQPSPSPTGSLALPDQRGRIDRAGRIVVAAMTVGLVIIAGRVAQLQLAPSAELKEHMQARITARPVPAARGDILDRRYRYVATTEFGYRAVVDPTELPSPPDEAILKLAQALDQDPAELGERIVSRMVINQARAAERARRAPQHAVPKDIFDHLRSFGRNATPAVSTTGSAPLTLASNTPAPPTADAQGQGDASGASLQPIRYLVLSDILRDEQVELVKSLGLRGVNLELRGVRHYPAGNAASTIVGKTSPDQIGLIGIESTFDKELRGSNGKILYVRDARGRPLWMGRDGFSAAQRGDDVRLSIDLEIQRIAHEELTRRVEECDAAGGRCVVMDPLSGEILAMVDVLRPVPDAVPFPWPARTSAAERRAPGLIYEPPAQIPSGRFVVIKPDEKRQNHPELARNRCVEDVYEPGSTFKTFIWASATELGVFKPDTTLNTGNGLWRTPYGRPLRDVHKHANLTWQNVLIESSNIGMSQAADKMSFDQMSRAIRRFGFGALTGINLPGETRGLVTSRRFWSKYTQTSVSFGQEVAVTPVQMVQAFAAFARPGELAGTMPRARLTALDVTDPDRSIVNRVVRADIAQLTRQTLVPVAAKIDENMARDRKKSPDAPHTQGDTDPRYVMFGKSGTAQIPLGKAPPGKMRPRGMGFFEHQYNSSFIAGAPVESPRLVVLVVIDDPGPSLRRTRQHYGSTTAGPAVRRIIERSLAYLGVPPSPPELFYKKTEQSAAATPSMAD